MSTGEAIGILILIVLWLTVVTILGVCVGVIITRSRNRRN